MRASSFVDLTVHVTDVVGAQIHEPAIISARTSAGLLSS
jgi:hypothetical protein